MLHPGTSWNRHFWLALFKKLRNLIRLMVAGWLMCVFLVFVCVVRMTTECGCVVSLCLLFVIYGLFYFLSYFFLFLCLLYFLCQGFVALCVCAYCVRILCNRTRCMCSVVSCACQLIVVALWVFFCCFLFIVCFIFL